MPEAGLEEAQIFLQDSEKSLEPYSKVVEIIQLQLRAPENLRVLKHVLTYAEFQFGERIPNQTYRERESGERMDNWTVELDAMILIYMKVINIYERNGSLSLIFKDNNTLPYYKKQLEILKPWSLRLNLDTDCRKDTLSRDKSNHILDLLSEIERGMASIYMHRNQFDMAEGYTKRSLSYARQYSVEGDLKTTLLLRALSIYYGIRMCRGDSAGGLIFAEEAYNCAAIAYNPVHPEVQVCLCIV